MFFYDDHILPDSGKSGQLEQHSTESIEPANHDTDHEIQKHYEDLKRSLSEEFNKKMTHWGQKKLSKESSDGRSGTGGGGGGAADDRQLSAEFRKKLDEWQRMKGSVDAEEPPPSAGAGKSFLIFAKLSYVILIDFDSGNSEAGMLDLRRRMGMDPWSRREKSAGKQDIQVVFISPLCMSSVMFKLQKFSILTSLCPDICTSSISGSRRSSQDQGATS